MADIICNICGSTNVNLVSNSYIYGKEYGKYPYVYLCSNCKAYVGVHPNNKPLGILADDEMRTLRKQCHDLFDKKWNTKKERTEQYNVLGSKLGLEKGKCHFSWMNKNELRNAIKELNNGSDN